MMKSLTRTETTVAIIFWMLVIQTTAGFFPSLYAWKWPSQYIWCCALVIAFSGTFSHFCMARAMLYADATIVLPMDFLRVPLTALAGWLIYSERLDAFTVVGAALILTGNLLNLKAVYARYRAVWDLTASRRHTSGHFKYLSWKRQFFFREAWFFCVTFMGRLQPRNDRFHSGIFTCATSPSCFP